MIMAAYGDLQQQAGHAVGCRRWADQLTDWQKNPSRDQ